LDPSAIHNLLLNLRLQLLGLPNLAKWGLLAFAGIIVLREGITRVWDARQRKTALRPGAPVPSALREGAQPALPAPDPLAEQPRARPDVVPQHRGKP